MLTTRETTNNDAQMIVEALAKKSKKTLFYRQKSLKKQADYFSPAYRDFILNIVKNSSLKIVNSFRESYITEIDENLKESFVLKKRRKNIIFTNIDELDALPHELGHAVDFLFGQDKALTERVIIRDSKTLYDIFSEEFEARHIELYQLVMNEYKNIINANVNENAYDILINNITKYRELKSIKADLKNDEITFKRREIQKELYKSKFVEIYYQLLEKKCYSILNTKYSPILDALSSKFDFDALYLNHHEYEYYRLSKYHPVYEFFANVFAAKVTSKHTYFDNLIKYLPKSFDAFERLFVIVYDHLQNNKRFTDVELKKVR